MDYSLPFFLFLFRFLSPAFTAARDTIAPGSPLLANQTLVSSGGAFALGFFSPAPGKQYVGVRFNTISDPTYVWVANRDRAVTGSNATLTVAANGTLSLTDDGSVLWSVSSPSPLTSAVAQLLDTGNLFIRESSATIADDTNPDGAAAWQSFWHPTDTMLADMKFGVNQTTGLNTTVTSWKSDTDPSSGEYQVYMDLTSDPQLFIVSGSRKIWRTSPADVFYSPTVPADQREFTFSWKFDPDSAVFSYHITDSSILMMIKINSTGVLQLWLWGAAPGWVLMDYAPKDICDFTSGCGPNSLCNATTNTTKACSCLPGYEVADAAESWAVGQAGCVQAAPSDCEFNRTTDTVVKLGNAKAPDTTGTNTNTSWDLDECKAACLANCSCTAYAATNISVGAVSGCVMWFGDLFDLRTFNGHGGQDVYVRTALAAVAGTTQSHAPNGSAGAPPVALIASISAVGFLLLLAAAGYFIWRRSNTTIGGVRPAKNVFIPRLDGDDFANEDDDIDFPLLDLEAVAIATDNFSPANKLGQGGFGPVYKGKLPDGQEIAVKRNAKTSSQGTDEFMNEVRLIAKLQHRNLVRLIGCSLHREERMLVYEYMPNKSLDFIIFDQARSMLLNWTARYQIIVGIARGLLYLHEDSRLKIIHRDLKASNILLDKDMNPKISDFGIARIFKDEDEINTRRVVGTYGYMSPEYALEGAFSVKSDVFSFGILMLEIISGRKNRGGYFTNNLSLVDYAWKLWKQGKILKLVDESMDCSYPTEEVMKCIKLALLCVQEMPEDRPVMSYVVLMLSQDAAALPEPKKSGYTAMKGYHFNSDVSTSKFVEVDSAPITILDAR